MAILFLPLENGIIISQLLKASERIACGLKVERICESDFSLRDVGIGNSPFKRPDLYLQGVSRPDQVAQCSKKCEL